MIGHLKQHSFTGSTDHDYTGLNGGEVLIFDGTNVISTNSNNLGTGTGNYVPKWNSNGSGLTDSNLIDDGTTVQTLLPLEFGTFASSISANTTGELIITPRQTTGASNIGIGTNNPLAPLHIKQNDFTRNTGQIFLDAQGFGAEYESSLMFGHTGNVRALFGLQQSVGKMHLKRSAGSTAFSATTNQTAMTWYLLTAGNRVGINNESPLGILDVVTTTAGGTNTILKGARADSGGDTLRLLSSASTINLVVEDGGNVGIGTAAPSAKVHILHTGSGNQLRAEGAASALFTVDDGVVYGSSYFHTGANGNGYTFNGDSGVRFRRSGSGNASIDAGQTLNIFQGTNNGRVGIGKDVNSSWDGNSTEMPATVMFKGEGSDSSTWIAQAVTSGETLAFGVRADGAVTVAGDFSGGTGGALYSGGTDLYNIFSTGGESTTASNGLSETGDDIRLGGTLTQDTFIDNSGFLLRAGQFSANTISAQTIHVSSLSGFSPITIGADVSTGPGFDLSGGTGGGVIYSASTDLYSIFAPTIAGGYISGSGTDNFVPLWNGTNVLENSIMQQFGTSAITVNGNVQITGDVEILGSATTIFTEDLFVEDNTIHLNSGGTHTSAIGGGIIIEDGVADGTNTTLLTDSLGNWEMNTGLVVNQSGSTSGDFRVESASYPNMFFIDASFNRLGIGESTTLGFVDIHNKNGNGTVIRANSTNASEYTLRMMNTAASVVNSSFRNSGRVDLAQNGAVTYMGNQSSNYLLQNVQITTQFSNTASFTGFHANRNGSGITLRATNNESLLDFTNDLQFRKGWGGNATATDGANVAMQINTAGRVGIGPDFNDVTLAVGGRLHVVGERADSAAYTLYLADSGDTAIMVVEDGGDVGIGTSAPGARLDVRGSAIFNEDGGDFDFRVEGDTKNDLFFVDASTDRVGIQTTSPTTLFNIYSDTALDVATFSRTAINIIQNSIGDTYAFNIGGNWGNTTNAGASIQPTVYGASTTTKAALLVSGGANSPTTQDFRGVYVNLDGVKGKNVTGFYSRTRSGYEDNIGFHADMIGGGSSQSGETTGFKATLANTVGSDIKGLDIRNTSNIPHNSTTYGVYVDLSGRAVPTGITQYAAYFDASGGNDDYAIVVPSGGGNVGIGTITPSATVDIVGDLELNGDFSGGTGGGVIYSGGTDLYNIFSTGGGGISKYAASVPMTGGTAVTVTHSLGGTDVTVQIKNPSGELVTAGTVDNYLSNSVDIEVSITGTYRVIIIG